MIQDIAKTFFSPKGILIFGCLLFYICFVGINALYAGERLSQHNMDYQRTLVYYQSVICQDSSLKAKTEGKNKCDEYAVFLSIAPWRRTLMDVFESNFICSGGSCTRWFNHLLVLFVCAFIGLAYTFVRHTAWTVGKVNEIRNSLPLMFGNSGLSSKTKKWE
jgi:hypothetical protein